MEEEQVADVREPEKEVKPAAPPSVSFFKLFCFADGIDYLLMLGGTIGAAVHGLALPIFLLVFGKLLNSLGDFSSNPSSRYHEISKYALYFIYLAIVIFFASWAEVACWMQTGERQVATLRIKYLRAIINQDVGYFDVETRTGEIVDSISANTITIQEAIGEKLGSFIHFMFTFIGGFVVGFATVWKLGLITLGIVPAIAVVGGAYTFVLTGLASKSREAYGQAGNIAEEVLSQIRAVYSFAGESKAVSSYAVALNSAFKLGRKGGLVKGAGVGAMYGVMMSCWALLLWYGGVIVRSGTASGGSVLSTIFAVLVGSIALGQAMPNVAVIAKARSAAYPIMKTISHVPTVHSNDDGPELPKVHGHLSLRDIHFSYPSRPDVKIFQDFNLEIPAGKSVAIVGASGSGKSTVVSLIERFYDPVLGEVLLDGHNIRTLKLSWLREQMGLVSQEPALFATTIEENILYGKPGATTKEIEDAAKAANAHTFISQLPDGYKTQVGERGVQLSGGQKQRIAIARAMIKNPSVLLFDEATSALDAESERVVQDALDKLMVGRTTVVVAHRLSTIRNANAIAVVQQGNIVELGPHEELMAKENGAYAALVRLQEMAKATTKSQVNRLSSHAGALNRSASATFRKSFSSSLRRSFRGRPSSAASEDVVESTAVSKDQPASTAYFRRLLKLNLPEWPFLLLGSLAAILAGFVNPAFAFIISDVLKFYYSTDHSYMKSHIQRYCIAFVAIGTAVFGVDLLLHYSFGVSGEALTKRVREMMFAAITRFEVGWFDLEENGSAQVAAKLATNATFVRAAMGDRIAIIIQNASLLVTAFIAAFVLEWRVALVVSATLPLLVFSGIAEQLFLKGFAGDIAKAHERATKLAAEAVSNVRTVAAFNAQAKVVELVARELDAPKRSSLRRGQIAGFGYGIGSFFLFSSFGLGLWYSGYLLKQGKVTFGNTMKAFFVLVLTSSGIAETIGLSPDIARSGQALKSVFGILDRKPVIDPDDQTAEKVESIGGLVEFRNVGFCYPSRPDVIIFQDLDLKVEPGQTLAVVGASGSGKSSIISLIERFYDPTAGRIMVDGKDIRKFNLRSYRRHVGLVQQEPALFATSIYENISYGREDATEAEVIEAAKSANAHNYISGLPDGYRTTVGERGAQLSGGQKQRVAIARAVLKNPSILLLDEATSALDAESESIVQEALDRLMRGRTTIVVAHRLSTIRNADQIAVIQDGKIVEKASHSDLVARPDGAYSRLIHLQQQERFLPGAGTVGEAGS